MGVDIVDAVVRHARTQPKKNAFSYKVYYLCSSLQALEELDVPVLSNNRFNLFSLYQKDHGNKSKPQQWQHWIEEQKAAFGLDKADGEVVLMCMPRVLGYAFNPVSFWFCLDKKGGLRAVLAEVRNTFKEHHNYMLFHEDQRVIQPDDVMVTQKQFHVSPFMEVKGEYRFRFDYSNTHVSVHIDYSTEEGDMLYTSVSGPRVPLTHKALWWRFFSRPLVTLKVIFLIHYQALRIVAKGITYIRKPPMPTEETTR